MYRLSFILYAVLLFRLPLPLRADLPAEGLFARTNLVAWCIVPFDSQKRGPEERAEMLSRLGIRRLAYDWRPEHIPTFDAEVAALRRHGIELTAWWFPAALNDEAKAILACLERHRLNPQLWVTMGTEPESDPTRLAEKIDRAVTTLDPICAAAARLGSRVALYNHLGWFGEPTHQVAVITQLRAAGHTNVGAVYNFHHAHAHIDDFPEQFRILQPHLLALNLNGMVRDGDRIGKKIIPLGTGDEELRLLQAVRVSGWNGPVGLIGHTDDDAEVKLRQELAGLERLAPLTDPPPGSPAVRTSRPASLSQALGSLSLREGTASSPANRAAGEPPSSGREPGSQEEKDWVDNRWQETDVGPFLASNLQVSKKETIAKGLTVKLGESNEAAVAYDTATGAVRAFWTDGFLEFDPTRFGLIGMPKPAGTLQFTAVSSLPSHTPESSRFHFRGLHPTDSGTVLEYRIGDARILEAPFVEHSPAGPVLVRGLWIDRHREPIQFLAAGHLRGTNLSTHTTHRETVTDTGANTSRTHESRTLSSNSEGHTVSALAISGHPVRSTGSHVGDGGGMKLMTLEPSAEPVRLELRLWRGDTNQLAAFQAWAATVNPAADPEELLNHRASRWSVLTTRGQRGPDTDFLAVDTLTLPYDNPWKALLFASGVDLGPDGAAYVCTLHGDVWRVTGIDDSLRELRWQRFATGLFQPLGLKVRDGEVFVLGRDRITRLHDENQDGEADFYESFFAGIDTSTGGHDYVTCLETDTAGNFFYVDPRGVHRVAADGRHQETLATGFRNPNGMGASPDGRVVTVAPQQGNWTPSSFIAEIRPGGYYGYGGPKPSDSRPLGFDSPMCWIPHGVDNSSGSQVWVPSGQWGPLGGQMLHLLWGRCGMMLVLRDTGGSESPARQGAVVPLPAKFLSGPNRGSFDPRDGSLFVAGSTGWQTSAVKDGALHRVRFTGQRVALPVGFHVRPDGLELTFSQPLDRGTAEDPGSYSLKQWNYRYAEAYGSKEWSVTQTNREGRDEVAIESARLQPNGRTVFLGIPGLKPAMQMELKYNVDAADGGKPLRGQMWLTVNETE